MWQENEVFPMKNFLREILSASFLFLEEYKWVQSPGFRELHSAARGAWAPFGAWAWHRTRWKPKCLGHVGHLHLSWILSSPGHLLLGLWEAEDHSYCPQRLRVKKTHSAGIWVCEVWLHHSYCDLCYSGILQNCTNSHKSFAEQINSTLQPSQGEKESFKQLRWATQWFSSKLGRQLCGAPKAPVLLHPLLRLRQHQPGCCSPSSSHDGGQGGGTVGPHTLFKERKGLTFLNLARSSSLLKRHWPAAKCVFPGLLQ